MKAYVVEFTLRSVVVAEDEGWAQCAAMSAFREIARDEEPSVIVERQVPSQQDLPPGWDFKCIPYGGDGMTWLDMFVEDSAPNPAVARADEKEGNRG